MEHVFCLFLAKGAAFVFNLHQFTLKSCLLPGTCLKFCTEVLLPLFGREGLIASVSPFNVAHIDFSGIFFAKI